MCGMHVGGLKVFSFSTWSWRHFECPRTPDFIFSAPNGTVVVDSMDSGIQLLSLDDRHIPPPRLASALQVQTLDQGRIVMVTPATRHRAHSLRTSTLAELLTISAQDTFSTLTFVLSASLEDRVVVYWDGRLQLNMFGDKVPKWTTGADLHRRPRDIAISPSGAWLATSHDVGLAYCIRMWDAGNGKLQWKLPVDPFHSLHSDITPHSSLYPDSFHPLHSDITFHSLHSDITFDTETRFYSYHDNHRVPHDHNSSPGASATHTVIRHEQQPWTVEESNERRYEAESSGEWILRGSRRICWIPLGYLGTDPDSHCWTALNTLVMIGEDEVVRALTFRR